MTRYGVEEDRTVAHVELSLSEPLLPQAREAGPGSGSLDRWAATVLAATEPCMIVDRTGVIVAASDSACELLGFGEQGKAEGRSLYAGVLQLLDFTAAGDALAEAELDRIPPLLAASSGRLARLLLRLQRPQDESITVDAVAAPLRDGDDVVGSLTFFATV